MSVTELIEAVKGGDTSKVLKLIEAGDDVNGHGDEQEWTPLNYAAGKGNLDMVKLLVDKGADVFNVGRDRRTPYQIAVAASRVEVARYLQVAEEKAGGDKDKISSRAWEDRPYCKAYHLRDLRRFPQWTESRIDWKDKEDEEEASADGDKEFSDDDIVFIHQDFTVTQSMWHDENIIFNAVTPAWKEFCQSELEFRVPTDFDLIPEQPIRTDSKSG
jgi:hypothetical protein